MCLCILSDAPRSVLPGKRNTVIKKQYTTQEHVSYQVIFLNYDWGVGKNNTLSNWGGGGGGVKIYSEKFLSVANN